jgi:uncharacterized protein (TIGR00725 family)
MDQQHADKIIICVIGSADRRPAEPIPDQAFIAAEEVGRLVAERGGIMLTGGKTGIMEAASKGANLAGGMVVGLLPSNSKNEANPYVTVALPTGMDYLRNYLTVRAADAVIMICGSRGTLHEATIAYGKKPIIVMEGTGGWSDQMRRVLYDGKHFNETAEGEVHFAASPEEAVDLAFDLVKNGIPE